MNENILAQINAEIASHLAAVARLQAARKALGGSNGTKPVPGAPKPTAAKSRAPSGALEEAMKKVVATTPGLSNSEIREKLKADGYRWSMAPLYVGKRLSALAGAKELKVKLDGNKRRYYPAK
jgi:hypothetical protein